MNNLNEDMNQTDAFERARKLREEAEALEAKAKVKQRLLKLLEISQDPYYDQYLNQMIKDLESGKATPAQVSREADRTYKLYQQRMGQKRVQENVGQEVPTQREPVVTSPVDNVNQPRTKDAVEFKIGAGIFSMVGAVFVLAAFVIFGFNFLQGIWQGVCLYAASVIVILLSELLVKRLNEKFSLVITGIGISCLYISTVINYLVLKNINGFAAAGITLVIALFSLFLSRKKDSAFVRMITFFGCYICFLPIKGFESELSFLIITGILLIINIASIFLPNQKNTGVISAVHLVAHTVFTGIATGLVLAEGMDARYVGGFVITSLVVINLIYYKYKGKNEFYLKILFSMALGFMAVFLVSVGCFEHGINNENVFLLYKLLTEAMAVVTSVVFFILWGKDERRWIQYYFIAALVVLFNGFSDYRLETTIGFIAIFVLTRLLYRVKEVEVLDCILSILMVLQAFYMCKTWYVIPFAVILLLSAFVIKRTVVFHEIVLTVGFTFGLCFQFDGNWTLPGCTGITFLLFLLFNHLPWLKKERQLPYNITNLSLAGLFCLCTVFCDEYYYNAVTMVIGAIMIVVAFRSRYGLAIAKKYLILAGFLVYMIFASHFDTPVIVSILLMIVAIGCVGAGFLFKDKTYRICGLVMAILVCIKLIVYDFIELESLPKAILFLTVGVIALGISFLYIYLEKKEDKEDKEVQEEEKGIKTDMEKSIDKIEDKVNENEEAMEKNRMETLKEVEENFQNEESDIL
ncbi:MAG: DUF2339 domain-containing protein [Suilimivivens sp.]